MYTEDEAKTKWCPFTRITTSGEEWHTNRGSHTDVHERNFDRCIGSACMAWRWLTWEEDGAVWRMTGPGSAQGKRDGVHEGCCGLAGRPS